jgi:PAS domain S-box-containing protein
MESIKILLIGNEEDASGVFFDTFSGHEITVACDLKEGMDKLAKESPEIVFAVSKVPDAGCIEILRKIKAVNPDIEIIIVADQNETDSAAKALRYGASDFIFKPLKDKALRVVLRRAEERIAAREKIMACTNEVRGMHVTIEEIKRKSEFQDKLISCCEDGVVITDEKGGIAVFNSGAEKIFGLPVSEVVGKMNFEQIYPEKVAGAFRRGFEYGEDVDKLNGEEVKIVMKDGTVVPVRFSGAMLYENGSVTGSIGIFRDLRELEALHRELVGAERLAATGQTVTRLAHYIKNILTGLRGGTYIVSLGLDKNSIDDVRAGWDSVQRNIGRISSLVSDLLSYSKERKPEYQECSPLEIGEEVCELMDVRAKEHGIELLRNFDSSIGEVLMDPDSLHRILLNLVANAIDACIFDSNVDKKHKVTVKIALGHDKVIGFKVSDNGSGMNDEVKQKLFTAFFSTKGGKGTGLGLLVTQKLVQEHGGSIDVSSQQSEGSVFIVKLPYRELSKPGNIA